MRSTSRLVGLAAAVSLLVAACGIEPEGQATTRRPETVPFDLLDAAPTTTTSTSTPTDVTSTTVDPDQENRVIYLWQGDDLTAVSRQMDADAGLAHVIIAVSAGPTAEEAASGLFTAISDASAVRGVSVARGTATVDLDGSFVETAPGTETAALAQIIFTLTAWPGVGRVAFTLEGGTVEVPRGDGTLTTEPLTRDDFPDLDAGSRP